MRSTIELVDKRMEEKKMEKKKKIPWYVKNANLYIALILIVSFAIGGAVAYMLTMLFYRGKSDAFELSLAACCLVSVAFGGIGGFLWLEKKIEEVLW